VGGGVASPEAIAGLSGGGLVVGFNQYEVFFDASGASAGGETQISIPTLDWIGQPPGAQRFVGYPAHPGSEAPRYLVTKPVPGGLVSAIVNGHEIIINPTTNTIVRVIN
jgi:hypothetical protein